MVLVGGAVAVRAAEEAPAATQKPAPTLVAEAPATKLAYGADDVLRLSRAQVSEDVIATYIQTAGVIYNLKPSDIVQLHNQGVTNRIINIMLQQGRTGDAATQPAPVAVGQGPAAGADPAMPVAPLAPVQPVNTGNPLFIPGDNAFAMAAFPPVQNAEAQGPSTLYVIPYSSPGGYRPVYSFYPGCSYISPSYVSYSSGCYNSYARCAPSTVVRLGASGHHAHSFHRR